MWQFVRHFVLVDGNCCEHNYEELRHLLASIAASKLAQQSVGVVLSIGEVAGVRVCNKLKREFGDQIRWLLDVCCYNLGREGATVNRDANLHAALAHTFDFAKSQQEIHSDLTLVTYTTVDAEFHRQYFSAVTFAFLMSGKSRNTTIWQPPVFHLKDFYSQAYAVRHASLFLSQAQLVSLTDPMSLPLPQSTYSIPLSLLRAIASCWEPNFQLDQSTGMWTKCWLTTIGRSSVQPIFLPVMRRCLSGDEMVPWLLVKRNALGLMELMYFWGALPLVLIGRAPGSVDLGRRLCLVLRSLLPMFAISWTHILMSTWGMTMIANFLALLYFGRWPEIVDSWIYLLCATAGILSLVPMLIVPHMALLRLVLPSGGKTTLVMLQLLCQSVVTGPIFVATAGFAEWHTAIQMLFLSCCSPSTP